MTQADLDYDDFVVCVISYFSYGWTQQCLSSLWKYFPKCRVLAIDNNPSKDDSYERGKTFQNVKSHWPYQSDKKIKLNWGKFCELEKDWLYSQSNIIKVIETPIKLSHGSCINLAVQHCVENKIKKIVLIEPDCVIYGKSWLHNLLKPLEEGFWMSSGTLKLHGKQKSKILHPCPSAWIIEHTKTLNFQSSWANEDINLKKQLDKKTNKDKLFFWDTGLKASYEFSKIGRAKFVEANDIKHYWGKSSRSDYRIMML